jgi:plasmid stabilization system protein ParE
MTYALTPIAKADILDIWSHIAQDSVEAADRVEQAIYDACSFGSGSSYARTYAKGPDKPLSTILDPRALSQLQYRL